MENSAEAEEIRAQAGNWTFEGDCSLLQWMQKIATNLEQRTNQTLESLDRLNVNVNRTGIALDNAANSLTALQYTQFVESRCYEDDDINANLSEVPESAAVNKTVITASTPSEVLKTFLGNNLQMLNKCHERYALDFEDSDEEEKTAQNCIYQPRNPHNERPLPHIYGSRPWQEHWHVGLCDGANDYSGDEVSEAFSESSTPEEDNLSYQSSNNAPTSNWASNTSLLNEKSVPSDSLIVVKNASTLNGSQAIFSEVERQTSMPIAASTIASHSTANIESQSQSPRITTILPQLPQHPYQYDLFGSIQNTPPPLPDAPPESNANKEPSQASSYSSSSEKIMPSRQPVDLFAEDNAPTVPASPQVAEAIRKPVSIKHKPVNLFDDDDFDSFMSEIVDKSKPKADVDVNVVPTAAPRIASSAAKASHAAKAPTAPESKRIEEGKKKANLFDSGSNSPDLEEPQAAVAPISKTVPVPKHSFPERNKPLNLFDSPESSPRSAPLFPQQTTTTSKIEKRTTKTKSLFDDDDDDDDFLNMFGAKEVALPAKLTEKTLLFDDDDLNIEEKRDPKTVQEQSEQIPDLIAPVKKTTQYSSKFESTLESKMFLSDDEPITSKSTTVDQSIAHKENNNEIEAKEAIKINEKNSHSNIFDSDDDEEFGIFSKSKLESTAESIPSAATNKNSNLSSIFLHEESKGPKSVLAEATNEESPTPIANHHLKSSPISSEPQPMEVRKDSGKTEVLTSIAPKIVSTKKEALFGGDDEEVDESLVSLKPASNKDINANENRKDSFSLPLPNRPEHEETNKHRVDTKTELLSSEINKTAEPLLTETPEKASSPEGVQQIEKKSYLTESAALERNLSIEVKTESVKSKTNFVNIFLDEPPDDDDFFEALGSSITVSSSKLSNDLEHNFFEPTLPTPPPITIQNEISNDQNESAKEDWNRVIKLFDDDFSSTQEPVKQSKEFKMPKHNALFDDQPPTDDEDFIDKISTSNVEKQVLFTQDSTEEQHSFLNEPPLDDHTTASSSILKKNLEATSNSDGVSIVKEDPHKISNSPKHLSLFDDEPPLDDDLSSDMFAISKDSKDNNWNVLSNLPEQNFVEPTIEIPNEKQEEKPNKTSDMSKNQLVFTEEPPEDYDSISIEANVEDSLLKSSTLSQKKEGKEISKHHVLFDDKPPLEDEFLSSAAVKTLASSTEEKLERNVHPIKADPKLVKDEKLKTVSKLPKLNINVQALLPNASRPIPKSNSQTTSGNCEENIKSKDHTDNAISSPINIPSNQQSSAVENENILTSLCKNRVRGPVKRRPSTRAGRQENYHKSLLAEEQQQILHATGDVTSKETKKDMPKVEENVATTSNLSVKASDGNPSLFSDGESDSDGSLFSSKKATTSKLKILPSKTIEKNVAKEAGNLFGSESEDDNFLSTLSAKQRKPSLTKEKDRSNKVKTPVKESKSSLFGDTESDDDDLFGKQSSKGRTPTTSSHIKTSKAPQPKVTRNTKPHDNPLADLLK